MSYDAPPIDHATAATTAERYLAALKQKFPVNLPPHTHFICVGHVTAENNLFLRELVKHGKVTLVPKATIEKPEDVAELKTIAGVEHVDKFHLRGSKLQAFFKQRHKPDSTHELKDMLKTPELAVEFMNQYTKPGENIIILDVGGYFANSLPHLEMACNGTHPQGWVLPERTLSGVTEVTVNGEYKYRLASEHSRVPILSFAKSLTKHPENEIVGPNCVRGTVEALSHMPELEKPLEQPDAKYGVLAVGDVGSQIVRYLKKHHGITAHVHDINADRMQHLAEDGHIGVSKEQLLAESDMLYVAPPAPVLTLDEIKTMKDGAVLSFATSIDDVVKDYRDLHNYPNISVKDKDGIEICRTYTLEGKHIHFICNGRSPNFYLHHPVDPTVILSLGLVFPSLAQLYDPNHPPATDRLNELKPETQEKILDIWKDHYPDDHRHVDFEHRPANGKTKAEKAAEAAAAEPDVTERA